MIGTPSIYGCIDKTCLDYGEETPQDHEHRPFLRVTWEPEANGTSAQLLFMHKGRYVAFLIEMDALGDPKIAAEYCIKAHASLSTPA